MDYEGVKYIPETDGFLIKGNVVIERNQLSLLEYKLLLERSTGNVYLLNGKRIEKTKGEVI